MIDKTEPNIKYPIDGEEYIVVVPEIEDASNFVVELKKDNATISYMYNNKIQTNGEYELIATDEAGNASSVNFTISNNPPTVSFTPNGNTTYQTEHIVQVNVQADFEIDEIKYMWSNEVSGISEETIRNQGLDCTNNENIVKSEVTGDDWYLWVLTTDEAGNTIVTRSNVFYFDNEIPEKPTITANIENGDITNKEVELNIQGNSTLSGLKNYEISLDNGNSWEEFMEGTRITASNEGKYNIIARTVNNVGTKGENSETFLFTIDKTKPNIVYPQEGEQYVEVVPEIQDENAFKVELKRNNITINYTYNDKITNNGEYELIVTDEAGNTSTVNFTIRNVYPEIKFSTYGDSTYSKEHKTTVNVIDDDLDESSLQYVWTQSTTEPREIIEWTSFKNGQEIVKNTESGTWYLWVKATDKVGNTTIDRTEGFNLDNEIQEIPIIGTNIENNSTTNKNIEITLNVKETLSGLRKFQYSLDNGMNWNDANNNVVLLQEEGDYDIVVRAINNVGTVSEMSETFSVKIDKTDPIINKIEDGKIYKEITIDVEDNSDYKIILVKDGQEIDCKNGDIINTPGVYMLTVIDDANNQVSVSFSIPDPTQDTQGPIISFSVNGNEEYSKEQSTEISVTDINGTDESSLKYLWKTDTEMPEETDFTESFENGETIVLGSVSGKYYLWIMQKI